MDRGEVVTAAAIKEGTGLNLSSATVTRALKKLGYSYKKVERDLYVREKPHVIQMRHKYINNDFPAFKFNVN